MGKSNELSGVQGWGIFDVLTQFFAVWPRFGGWRPWSLFFPHVVSTVALGRARALASGGANINARRVLPGRYRASRASFQVVSFSSWFGWRDQRRGSAWASRLWTCLCGRTMNCGPSGPGGATVLASEEGGLPAVRAEQGACNSRSGRCS